MCREENLVGHIEEGKYLNGKWESRISCYNKFYNLNRFTEGKISLGTNKGVL